MAGRCSPLSVGVAAGDFRALPACPSQSDVLYSPRTRVGLREEKNLMFRSPYLLLLPVFIAVACVPQARAVESNLSPATASSSGTWLSPIIVTAATGTPAPLDTTLAPVIVLGPKQIASFFGTDLGSLLQFNAGLDIARNGGPGQPVSLFLRGTGSAETLFLIDGFRVNSGVFGAAPVANIRTDSLSRVEIVESPRSALYGSGAIGGVVSIRLTRPARQGLAWGFGLRGGTYATRGADAYIGIGNGPYFGSAQMNFDATGGFPPRTTSDNASAYRNLSVHIATGVKDSTHEAYVTWWHSSGTTDYLDFFLAPVSEDYTDQVSGLHLNQQMNSIWHSRILLGQFYGDLQQIQSPDFSRSRQNSIDWRNNIDLGAHQILTLGLYAMHEHVSALSYGQGYDSTSSSRAAYTQDQLDLGPQRLVLAIRSIDYTSFGTKTVWNADYGYLLSPSWRLTTGVGTGFRAPAFTDRFGYGGNPNLKPEYAHSYTLGLYHRLAANAVIGLNLYRSRISDLITYSGTGMTNIGRATVTGANLFLRAQIGNWRINPGINIQRPENDLSGRYLPRRSRRSATLNLTYAPGRWQVGVHILATGPRKDSDFSHLTDAGYMLVTVTGMLRLAPHWHLSLRLENLFDHKYQTAAGYRSPGRGIYLGVNYAVN